VAGQRSSLLLLTDVRGLPHGGPSLISPSGEEAACTCLVALVMALISTAAPARSSWASAMSRHKLGDRLGFATSAAIHELALFSRQTTEPPDLLHCGCSIPYRS